MIKTVLKSCSDSLVVEIPRSIVNLYSLKEGAKFIMYAKEVENHLIINLMTKINDE